MNRSNINERAVHDLAAYLFWSLSEKTGFSAAADEVLDTDGVCLFDNDYSEKIITIHGLHDHRVSSEERLTVMRLAANLVIGSIHREENLNGIIYSEDDANGRSPSAINIPTKGLAAHPKKVMVSGSPLPRIGRLCIRHPLPAVVFSEARPPFTVFEVADTRRALGFQMLMYFSVDGITQIDQTLYVSTGQFHIPVPSADQGDKWNRVIQNAYKFVRATDFWIDEGRPPSKICFSW